MKKSLWIIILLLALGIVLFLFNLFFAFDLSEGTIDEEEVQNDLVTSAPADGAEPVEFSLSGELLDVTEGADVRGVKTTETTTGTAMAGFSNGEYVMEAVFTDLPDPVGDDFYEGWVVRREGEFSVISTGALEKEGEGEYSNIFTSSTDLLDHDFYVLTLEPNDGDPAPADHILEGVMIN